MFNQKLNFKKNRTLQGGLPQMNKPIEGWSVPLTLQKITQSIVNGDKVETVKNISFSGVVDTIKDDELQFKPDNLRSFAWYRIYALAGSLNLSTGDKIIFNNKRYKVMSVKDLSLYAYVVYDIVLDYQ